MSEDKWTSRGNDADFIEVDRDDTVSQQTAAGDTVNSITEERGRKSGNEKEEEERVNEEVRDSCNFPEAMSTVRTLRCFLETSKAVHLI
jgi:hypothetical protein